MPKSNTATPHLPKKQLPVGSQKDQKLKVKDGQTQKVKWRQSKHGFVKDFDGDPTANVDHSGEKERKTHTVHEGRRATREK